jgi:hypothetical protein
MSERPLTQSFDLTLDLERFRLVTRPGDPAEWERLAIVTGYGMQVLR